MPTESWAKKPYIREHKVTKFDIFFKGSAVNTYTVKEAQNKFQQMFSVILFNKIRHTLLYIYSHSLNRSDWGAFLCPDSCCFPFKAISYHSHGSLTLTARKGPFSIRKGCQWVHTAQLVKTGRLHYEMRPCEWADSHSVLMIPVVFYTQFNWKLNRLLLTDWRFGLESFPFIFWGSIKITWLTLIYFAVCKFGPNPLS